MKIAIFHELPKGGARRAVNEMALRLKKNHLVDLFTTEIIEESEKFLFNKVFFYNFRPKKWKGGNWKIRLYKDSVELFKLWLLHKKIAKEVKGKKYDVFLINPSRHIEAPFVLRYPNARKIFYAHDPYYRLVYEPEFTFPKNINLLRKKYENLNRFIRKILDKKNLSCADIIITNSRFAQKQIKKIYGKESTVLYLGVDQNFFVPKEMEKEYDVLFIGSTDPIDGYDLFMRICEVIGRAMKAKVLLTDKEWLESRKLRKLYQKSRIVLCLSRNEPFGLISLEAMACGVPVIAVDEGGYKESIVDGKTGFLVERDPKKISEKIKFLLANPSITDKIGKNGRDHVVKNWTWDKSVSRFLSIIKNVE